MLETARFDADNTRSYLFLDPVQVFSVQHLGELPELFEQIECSLTRGKFVAGLFGYECGYHFENIGDPPDTSVLPLAWLGVYERPRVFDHTRGEFEQAPDFRLSDNDKRSETEFAVSDCGLTISEADYASALNRIKCYIAAGDTYQVNFTDELRFCFSGSPAALFTALRARQSVPYAAMLNLGESCVLSFSPELFFRISGNRIITRPMKGTARRGRTLAEDRELAQWLAADAKNRSENVMIVDLLRNDLGRICETGSVRVDDMFAVEKYETLLQMTSTVFGQLRRGLRVHDIFQSLFPCGSVTGAPKIRTMQIIRELEQRARGVYTGAIGFFSPRGDAVFNVAIRTLVLHGCDRANSVASEPARWSGSMGVGSGIVFDSEAADEYRECCLKADFLSSVTGADYGPCRQDFQLIESMLWDGGTPLLELHLKRLRESAEYFGFAFDEPAVREQVAENAQQLRRGVRYKVRLLLSRGGEVRLDNSAIQEEAGAGRVVLSAVRLSSADRFLFHKTTRRELYDCLYADARRSGYDDVIFANENDEITEGAISNVFVEIGERLCTPPISSGLLPGVFREHVLSTNPRAREQVLKLEDFENAAAVYICNAVRGMRKVRLVVPGS
ncbi:MAG: aminodeoxychorismate synthase component I [Terriglobales bacterium]